MELKLIEAENQKIAEVVSDKLAINDAQDALDIMANADYLGAKSIILYEKNLKPDFFDLRTGMAGEIVQKFANYHMQLAVVGMYEKYESKSLNAFIAESNRGSLAFFVSDREAAIAKLIGESK